MKINKRKIDISMARACIDSVTALASKAELPRPTVAAAITGRGTRPGTAGKIAKALGVDVTDIIELED